MREFTHHSCATSMHWLRAGCSALHRGVSVVLQSGARFDGFWWRIIASLVLDEGLTRVELFKGDLVFERTNLIGVLGRADG